MVTLGRTGQQEKDTRVAAFRSAGAGYVLYQAYWLITGSWFSAEWSVLQIGALGGAICVAPMGVAYARLVGFRSWPELGICVLAAELGGVVGIGVALFLGPLSLGPFIAAWLAIGWASVGLLAVGRSAPRWIKWAASCTMSIVGLAASWLAFQGRLTPDFDYETYGLTLGIVHAMLLGAGAACYYMSTRLRGEGPGSTT